MKHYNGYRKSERLRTLFIAGVTWLLTFGSIALAMIILNKFFNILNHQFLWE